MTNNPHSESKILVAMELSNSKWMLAFTNGATHVHVANRSPRRSEHRLLVRGGALGEHSLPSPCMW